MLKSTYKSSGNGEAASQSLPPGWTEHKAPTGHTYYHNASTGESTYKRPSAALMTPSASFMQHQAVAPVRLSDPAVANAFMAQYGSRPPPQTNTRRGFAGRGGRGGRGGGGEGGRERPQPADKPKSTAAIPGCEPWILVYTKYGRRFAFNPEKNASYWRIPERLKAGILELDQARIREKVDAAMKASAGPEKVEDDKGKREGDEKEEEEEDDESAGAEGQQGAADDSSEYEEIEVTDEEDAMDGDGEDDDGNPAKRKRTEEPAEFDEDDIAFQLQAMGQEYGLEPGDYDDGNMDEWPDGTEGVGLSDEDARALFKDLLNDFRINPYSPWEKLIEEGKVMDDPRYTVLSTTAERKEAWDEWSRDKIKLLRDQRAREEKKDPRIPYMAFLQDKATPKLYWPEFKRKHRKEPAMRDSALSDRDRERWYREHVARLKLPQATLKADLTALLRSVPLAELNGRTNPAHLPPRVLTDLRFISLDTATRDPLVEAYIQSLPSAPEEGEPAVGEDEAVGKAKVARERRERALREREKAAAEERRRTERRLQQSRAALREGEMELERAMNVRRKKVAGEGMDVDRKDE